MPYNPSIDSFPGYFVDETQFQAMRTAVDEAILYGTDTLPRIQPYVVEMLPGSEIETVDTVFKIGDRVVIVDFESVGVVETNAVGVIIDIEINPPMDVLYIIEFSEAIYDTRPGMEGESYLIMSLYEHEIGLANRERVISGFGKFIQRIEEDQS